MSLEKKLAVAVARRQRDGTARSLQVLPPSNVDFCSNDYLGLSRDPALALSQEETLAHGSTGSRLVTGTSRVHVEVEDDLASFYGAESALVFNSGYLANLSVMSCVPQEGDIVFFDQFVHNSCREGLRLSRATTHSFQHNDIMHLMSLLKSHASPSRQVVVVVESVYSMDGDVAPILELVELCESYGASLVVDEAHSTAVMGPAGSGLVRALGLERRVFCIVYTFGKGMGIHGAVVCGSIVLKAYLVNYARPFIYSTSLPQHDMKLIQRAHEVCAAADGSRSTLQSLIAHFRAQVEAATHIPKTALLPSVTAIQGIVVSGNEAVLYAAAFMTAAGFNVVAIRAPTVPVNEERLRIIIHAFNSTHEIDSLVDAIELYFQQRPLGPRSAL
ncbi:8-amino-7-oxononanoate synthase [Aphanomyces invadans]|uniref:8-amino-7-oxononanoate synthase n=1 Tax=Aphanomyces invadans TaxID=157072 RepID=A0A024U1I0_9STRA|nr:8-amino-7-oxononanoate synthase [Aphanomyces invadans]ETW00075.1 8-amino-7-oxononanoate synthase [Aphanomyces invadans]|eukprot:XP_008871100.1 8-amino-7-oxononanoate synthase [Aphanomyces invadans]